jgi:type I restriction enzyme S subunit
LADKLEIEDVQNRPLEITSCAPVKRLDKLIEGKIQNGLFVRKGVVHMHSAKFLNVQDIYGFPPKTTVELDSVTCAEKELASYKLKNGDVIYNRSSLVKDGIGWAYLCNGITSHTVYDCHLMRLTPNDEVMPEYLFLYSISPWARKYFMCISQTTTMTTIGQEELGSLPVPLPNLKLQMEIVSTYKMLMDAAEIAGKRQGHLKILHMKITSELLSGTGAGSAI